MRHRKTVKKLGRTREHRKALLANLSINLFTHKRIVTTLAKAKALRSFSEKLITSGKKQDVAARRHVFQQLHNKKAAQILFDEIAPKYAERNGGYTRVLKMGKRNGDASEMAVVELVDFEKTYKKKSESKAAKKKEKKKETEAKAADTEPQAEEAGEEEQENKKEE